MGLQAQAQIKKPRFKTGDQVQVISGKAKGQVGEVLKVNPKQGTVLIKEVNMVKRHTKARSQNESGGIIPMESPINYSNVLPFCEGCGRGVRKICENKTDCRNFEKSK